MKSSMKLMTPCLFAPPPRRSRLEIRGPLIHFTVLVFFCILHGTAPLMLTKNTNKKMAGKISGTTPVI